MHDIGISPSLYLRSLDDDEKLVLKRSDLDTAKPFQDWVTREVVKGYKAEAKMTLQMGKAYNRISRQAVTTEESDVRYEIRVLRSMRCFF